MHYMHYKDYIHHGLAAEKTTPPLPQGGGEPSGWVGGGVGVPAHIHINYTNASLYYILHITYYILHITYYILHIHILTIY